MMRPFWISFFISAWMLAAQAQDIGKVVSTTADQESKAVAKEKVVVAFNTTLDSFGLDWSTYGVKLGEGIDNKFNKSMLDWLILSKLNSVDELVALDPQNPAQEYTHLVQWNLAIRKLNTQGKVQQFQLSFDYYIVDKKNPSTPFYRGSITPELRTFPADLVKQIPDVLNKSLVNFAVPHWQKIRQTLVAMESSQDSFFVTIKNFKNINYVFNLMEYWKNQGKNFAFEPQLDSFDQVEARVKILFRGSQAQSAMKVINPSLPTDTTLFPFALKAETPTEESHLSFLLN